MFYRWIIVGMTLMTLLFSFGYNVSIGAFLGSFSKEFNWSHTLLSIAVSINMLTWGFLQPLMGRWADKYGPKKLLMLGTTLMGLSMVLCSTISSLWQLYLYYGIFTAVGFSAAGSLVNSILIARWFKQKKGTAMGFSTSGINIGQLLVLMFVGYSLTMYGWRETFMILGIVMLIILLPVIGFLVKNQGSSEGSSGQGAVFPKKQYSWKEAIQTKQFWFLSTSFMGCGFTLYLMVAHLPSYALDLGATPQTAASLLGIAGGVSIVGTVFFGSLSDRFGQEKVLFITHLLRTISFFVLYRATTVLDLQWDMILYGFSSFAIIPLVTSYAAGRFGTKSLGAIMGTVWMLHQISASLGVFVGGVLRDLTGSYHVVYLIGTVVLIISTAITLGLKEKKIVSTNISYPTVQKN